MKQHLLKLACASACIISANASAALIDFDGTGAPPAFVIFSQLTDLYASQGVSFSGTGTQMGGSILNQLGGFGFNARSGTDFLALNSAWTGMSQQIFFSSAQTDVSIYAAAFSYGDITMSAYDQGGALLSSMSTGIARDWTQLSLSGAGIYRVVIERAPTASWFGLDDLSFSNAASDVPEPASSLLIGLGLLGLAARRRKQAK